MKKICKNCKHWTEGHDGYWETKIFGNCTVLNQEVKVSDYSLAFGLVEGCVDVKDRCDTFEFVTQMDFGCVHFKPNQL